MSDCREILISDLKTILGNYVEASTAERIIDAYTRCLHDYDISQKETALATYDDENGRILKRYFACLYVDGKSKGTIYQYGFTLKNLAAALGKKYTDMQTYDIRYFLAAEKQRGVSNSTVETTRANISAFFQWMTAEEIIPKNPCVNIKPIKCSKEIKTPFSSVEIDLIRSACKNPKERAIVEVLLSTGLRVSELVALNISDIDFSDGTVRVRHGKGDKERITHITDVAVCHLKEYLAKRKNLAECVFLSKKRERMTDEGIRYLLHTIGKRAGVDNVHPHRFRRTFASGLAARGMDVQAVQKLLGHVNINTTMTYVYTSDKSIQMAYQKYAV